MQRYLIILFCFLLCTTCDDGDIITINLEFEGELERCDNFEDSYILYDTREDPNEALILVLPKNEQVESFFTTPTPQNEPELIPINGTSVRFSYRTYNRALAANELCNIVPPADLVIINDSESDSGTVEVTVTVIDDDNDGIPSADEDLNGNGNFDDDDSDNDGIANYLDQDDDNDNVLTSAEDDNEDGDNNPFTDARDTDDDGIPDYLDDDDDGDEIDTRLEDEDEDENPLDDFQESTDGTDVPPRFLDPNAAEAFPDAGFIDNTYTRTATTTFTILNANIGVINSTEIQFGVLINTLDPVVTVNDD